jgi:plasmid stabilization system protein ParE
MSRLEVSEDAAQDLEQILWYISRREHNVAVGQKWVGRLVAECAAIAASPGTGTRKDDLRPGIRCVPFRAYLIFFTFDPQEDLTRIIRVLHGATDVRKQFRPSP